MNDGGNVAVSPHSSDILFCVGNVYNAAYFLAVSHTSDGSTFERDTLALGSRGWAVAFDPVDPNRVYVGGDSAYSYPCLLITTDCGSTWTMSRSGLVGAVWAIAVDPTDPQLVYTGTNNGVFRSTNAGATWTATNLTQQTRALAIDPNHPNNLFAGTYTQGVFSSTDAGATWTAMNDGLTNLRILSMSLRPGLENTIFVGTEGGSVFRTSLPTALSGPLSDELRTSEFTVSPNPCRGTAVASAPFAARSLPFALSIWDASGRLLATHAVRTTTFELHTSDLPTGTYFVRLTSGRNTITRRLVVQH